MSLASVLLVLFIALKLLHVIAWSWFWVLSPIWLGIPIYAIALLMLLILHIAARRAF